MKDLHQWLYDRPGTEIRITYQDEGGQVRPEARQSIIRGTFGSYFLVEIIGPHYIPGEPRKRRECIGRATGWGADEHALKEAIEEAMKKAGEKGSWA